MKGYYTSKLLQKEAYQSVIFMYMDRFLMEIDNGYLYTQFIHNFNTQGEFIYRAIHLKQSPFDRYDELTMRVNDEGVFIEDIKHVKFTKNYLDLLGIFKQKCTQEEINNLYR